MPEIIFRYFPDLNPDQRDRIIALKPIYELWNSRINVISRKDMDNFYIHHVLHSMAIARIISFSKGTSVLDVGTGGGFPGIPLAILFPDSQFTLLDSIEKKIKVVSAVAEELKLTNVRPQRKRVEEEKGKYDFVISRAVTGFKEFVKLTEKNISSENRNSLKNGVLYLKGGNLDDELKGLAGRVIVKEIREFFTESFFDTKKVVCLPIDI